MAGDKSMVHLFNYQYGGPECESRRECGGSFDSRDKSTQVVGRVTCPECLHWMLKRAVTRMNEAMAEMKMLQAVTEQCLKHGTKWVG